MQDISPEQYPEILAEYHHWRDIGRRVNSRLVGSLSKEDIHEAGRRLGILRRGILCFDTEDTMTVLMDYAIRHVRRKGQNAVERFLSPTPPADQEEAAWLRSVCQAHYRILQIEKVHRGFGLVVRDILRNETELLIDVSLSSTAPLHGVLASHVYTVCDCWATTGAALPVGADVLRRLGRQIERQFGRQIGSLSAERETELATLAIRTCLAGGMSERVRYEDKPPAPHLHRSPAPALTAQRTGRNAPCPCGSGRKFKNCCLR
jgi:hypothetical protein